MVWYLPAGPRDQSAANASLSPGTSSPSSSAFLEISFLRDASSACAAAIGLLCAAFWDGPRVSRVACSIASRGLLPASLAALIISIVHSSSVEKIPFCSARSIRSCFVLASRINRGSTRQARRVFLICGASHSARATTFLVNRAMRPFGLFFGRGFVATILAKSRFGSWRSEKLLRICARKKKKCF